VRVLSSAVEPVRSRVVRWAAVVVGVVLAGVAGCTSPGRIEASEHQAPTSSTVEITPASPITVTTIAPPLDLRSSPSAAPGEALDRPHLGWLTIEDRPIPSVPYRRDDWPTWLDPDGNGCDARDDVLRSSSLTPVAAGCDVEFGLWTSIYDGRLLTAASEVDLDHVVALEQAHRSGGWRWSPQQRALFSNDPENLFPVSASSNRSKGSSTPDEWRPPAAESWCETASVYVTVKVRYQLTVTTAERDALGQMLDTCPS
jgi:hypothetical protein